MEDVFNGYRPLTEEMMFDLCERALKESFFSISLRGHKGHYYLSDEQAERLGYYLKRNEELTDLILGVYGTLHMSTETLLILLKAIDHNQHLRTFAVSKYNFSSDDLLAIGSFLVKNSNIQEFLFIECNVVPAAITMLANFVKEKKIKLAKINLSRTKVSSKNLITLIEAISFNHRETKICLVECELGDEGVAQLVKILIAKKIRGLTLKLARNDLTDAACESLVPLIKGGFIVALNVFHNKITDKGVKLLIAAAHKYNRENLPYNGKLISISCTNGTLITDKGLKCIYRYNKTLLDKSKQKKDLEHDGLKMTVKMLDYLEIFHDYYGIHLFHLKLTQCGLNEKHAIALASLISAIPAERIGLYKNPLKCGGLMALTNALLAKKQTLPDVTHLNFNCCQIADMGFQFLLQALELFPNLKRLIVNGNHITNASIDKLAQRLNDENWHPSLTFINLADNHITDKETLRLVCQQMLDRGAKSWDVEPIMKKQSAPPVETVSRKTPEKKKRLSSGQASNSNTFSYYSYHAGRTFKLRDFADSRKNNQTRPE